MRKKNIILVLILILCLAGCARTANHENKDYVDTAENAGYIGAFEKAPFDKYNSYASENGLKDSKIYVDGIIKEKSIADNTINFILQQKDKNEWIVSVGITPVYTSEMIDELIGKEVRVFGKYVGFSDRVKMPGVHIMDENFENPELYVVLLDENGEEKEIVSFLSDGLSLNLMREFFLYDSNISVAELSGEDGKVLLIGKYISINFKEEEIFDSSQKIGSILSFSSREKWFDYNTAFIEFWNKEINRISSITVSFEDKLKIEQEYIWYQEEVEDSKGNSIKTANITTGQKNALGKAKNYLSVMAFSYSGLIEQLKYDKFSDDEATYAADNCGADWNEQASVKAKNYMDIMSFSKKGLIEQLEFDGFTTEQATYGAEANGY